MVVKVAAFLWLAAAASAVVVQHQQASAPVAYAPAPVSYAPAPVAYAPAPAHHQKLVYAEPEDPPQYEYEYSVQDPQSGDVKSSKENRNGDVVHGYYSLVQPDGVQRIVEYTSSKEHGFNAVVRYEGTPAAPAKVLAPAPVQYASAPIAKVAYAQAPVAKVSYAPAQLAYAQAPVAKFAYAAAPAQVAYQPAPVAKVTYAPAPAPVAYASAPVAYAPAQAVTYAQPIAKVAYSPAASVGHVSYASPVASYHH